MAKTPSAVPAPPPKGSFEVGTLVKCFFDTGARGLTTLFGIVIKAGEKTFTVKWESGLQNRRAQGDHLVEPVGQGSLLEAVPGWLRDESARLVASRQPPKSGMHLYSFTRHTGPKTTETTTNVALNDLEALESAVMFADVWEQPIEVVLQSGHKVTVSPKPARVEPEPSKSSKPSKHRTRAAYRRYLNEMDVAYPSPRHKHGRYEQRKRAYGDYLYAQDREKFDVDYAAWLEEHPGTERVEASEQNAIKTPGPALTKA